MGTVHEGQSPGPSFRNRAFRAGVPLRSVQVRVGPRRRGVDGGLGDRLQTRLLDGVGQRLRHQGVLDLLGHGGAVQLLQDGARRLAAPKAAHRGVLGELAVGAVEDALHATRAAVEEGIVPGGGVALIRAQSALDGIDAEGEQAAGVSIVRRVLEAPLAFIAENAGIEWAIVVDKVKKLTGARGFNAATEEYEDLMKAGILDPTKVVRLALQNAASVAGLLLTTDAVVTEKPKEEKMPPMPPGGAGGMY